MFKFIKDTCNGFFNLKSTLFIGLAYTNYEEDNYANIYCLLEEEDDYLEFKAFIPRQSIWHGGYTIGYLDFPEFSACHEELEDDELWESAFDVYHEAKQEYYKETKAKVFSFLQEKLEHYNFYLIGHYLINLDNVRGIYMEDPIESDPENTTLEISWTEPDCVKLHILISVEDAKKTLQDLGTRLGEIPTLDITTLVTI